MPFTLLNHFQRHIPLIQASAPPVTKRWTFQPNTISVPSCKASLQRASAHRHKAVVLVCYQWDEHAGRRLLFGSDACLGKQTANAEVEWQPDTHTYAQTLSPQGSAGRVGVCVCGGGDSLFVCATVLSRRRVTVTWHWWNNYESKTGLTGSSPCPSTICQLSLTQRLIHSLRRDAGQEEEEERRRGDRPTEEEEGGSAAKISRPGKCFLLFGVFGMT